MVASDYQWTEIESHACGRRCVCVCAARVSSGGVGFSRHGRLSYSLLREIFRCGHNGGPPSLLCSDRANGEVVRSVVALLGGAGLVRTAQKRRELKGVLSISYWIIFWAIFYCNVGPARCDEQRCMDDGDWVNRKYGRLDLLK